MFAKYDARCCAHCDFIQHARTKINAGRALRHRHPHIQGCLRRRYAQPGAMQRVHHGIPARLINPVALRQPGLVT